MCKGWWFQTTKAKLGALALVMDFFSSSTTGSSFQIFFFFRSVGQKLCMQSVAPIDR